MREIKRKKDTGEAGNGGQFGTTHREEAEVSVDTGTPSIPGEHESIFYRGSEIPGYPEDGELSICDYGDGTLGVDYRRTLPPIYLSEKDSPFIGAVSQGAYDMFQAHDGTIRMEAEDANVPREVGTAMGAAEHAGAGEMNRVDEQSIRDAAAESRQIAETQAEDAARLALESAFYQLQDDPDLSEGVDFSSLDTSAAEEELREDITQSLVENWDRIQRIATWRRNNLADEQRRTIDQYDMRGFDTVEGVAGEVARHRAYGADTHELFSEDWSGPDAHDIDVSPRETSAAVSDDGALIFE